MRLPVLAFALILVATPAAAQQSTPRQMLEEMGRAPSRQEVARAVDRARDEPLGTAANPVRVSGPGGERAYIARLRCADGHAPRVGTRTNAGIGAFGTIVDVYPLDCGNAAPGQFRLIMDMYHDEHEERQAPAGFSLIGGRAAPRAAPSGPPPMPDGPTAETPAGPFRVGCVRNRPHLLVGPHDLGSPSDFFDCDNTPPALAGTRSFPSGETLLLILAQSSGVANSGVVIYVRPGAAPKLLSLSYMTEFGEVLAPNRLRVVAGGVTNASCPAEYSATEITIDWVRARIVRERPLGRSGGCRR